MFGFLVLVGVFEGEGNLCWNLGEIRGLGIKRVVFIRVTKLCGY